MSPLRTQQVCRRTFCHARFLMCAGLLLFLFMGLPLRAQTPSVPSGILGQILGDDVSVIGPSHVVSGSAGRAIEFSSGGTIVVFSGKARVEFTDGGELDICGPAKFTVLSSGEALTVALSFGRVRVRFNALRPITIYMPLAIATPLPIENNSRDTTIGLTNTGTMCVLASQGAVRLQNQLSGESAIVPQPSEVFIPNSSFASLPPAVGQCDCDFSQPLAQQPPPLLTTPSIPAPRESASSPQIPQQSSQANALILSNRSSAAETQSSASGSQPPSTPAVPPIGYTTKSVVENTESISVATLILAKEAAVQPEWIFHGTVIDRGKERSSQRSESPALQTSRNQENPKKRGFWEKLRRFFTGS